MRWVRLLVSAAALLLCFSAGGASAANVWAAVGLSECNATCDARRPQSDGVQRISFGCYPADSPSVRRLDGAKLFLAVSTAGQLSGDSCADPVPPDAPTFVRCRRAAGCNRPASHSWQLDLPSAVTATCQAPGTAPAASDAATTPGGCGQPGLVTLRLGCRSSPGTAADESRCLGDGLPKPESPAVPCRRLAGCQPVWKAGAWGTCSRDCGLGEMARTVECSQLTDSATEGPVYLPAPGKCADGEARPHSREYCVLQPECPPYYRLRPGKCLPAFSAATTQSQRWCNETGLRPSNAECVQLVGDAGAGLNQTRRRPAGDCSGSARPPPFQRCRVDAETLAQRGIACVDVEVTAPPRLLPDPPGSQLVQMERLPAVEARCGQTVTLIPGTRLRLHCGVANYKADELRWRKLGRDGDFRPEKAKAAGGAKGCGRICVSNGDLVFRRFKPRDAGTYEVTAGSAAKATVRLAWHSAYDAFLNAYLPRAHLLRRLPSSAAAAGSSAAAALGADGWAAEQPSLLARDTLAWVVGRWSECPCDGAVGAGGGRGRRRRTVRCERLRSGVYSVVKDELCARQLGLSPPAAEDCERSCPSWRVGDWEGECPASHCYLPGVSLELRSVTCRDAAGGNATLPDAECHRTAVAKPESARQCPNAACQPGWSVGTWSACSVSCGAFGFRSRRVQCLWSATGLPAGLACERLAIPRGHRSCYEGPCHMLGCVDLSPVCKIYQASALCAHPSLRKSCCATCNTYQLFVYQSMKRT